MIPAGYSIAPMTMADYDQVIRLWRATPGIGLSSSDEPAEIEKYLERNPGFSYVARRGGEVVGALLAGHDGRRGFLHHLAVAGDHRRAGLGRVLVSACLERMGRAGLLKCHLFVFADNADAFRFWQAVGFGERTELRLASKTLL